MSIAYLVNDSPILFTIILYHDYGRDEEGNRPSLSALPPVRTPYHLNYTKIDFE